MTRSSNSNLIKRNVQRHIHGTWKSFLYYKYGSILQVDTPECVHCKSASENRVWVRSSRIHLFIDLFLREPSFGHNKLSRVRVLFLKGSSSIFLLSCLIYSDLRTVEKVRGIYLQLVYEQEQVGTTVGGPNQLGFYFFEQTNMYTGCLKHRSCIRWSTV